ncbi:MAG: glycosyltransferase [Bacteroidetes bacterium]|jgi:glycosyltransferase involved in cell wall biosynthesis|nr:MAG: glycosyltransferase [Bacteroidota bacterium]
MRQDDKTLVILSPAFPANESETYWIPFMQLMVKALKKNYPELNIIALAFLYPGLESTYRWNGVQVISFGGMYKNKFHHILLWRKTWKALKKIHREHKIIGLFSAWCGECAFIGKYFAKRHSLRHISWICGRDALKTNKWVRFIRPRSDELAAMSPFLVKEFSKNHGIIPAHIIPNAIDPVMFTPSEHPERKIDILGAGSLVVLKQYDLFVEVIATVKQSLPTVRALQCGDGDERTKLESLIKKLELEDNMELLGSKKHEEVISLMQQTKLFLHTSSFEGFGGVCLEALYAGAHVISFHYPLDHPVPHWHVAANKKEMASKAIEILQDRNTDYSPVLVFSMDDSAKMLMTLYETVAV